MNAPGPGGQSTFTMVLQIKLDKRKRTAGFVMSLVQVLEGCEIPVQHCSPFKMPDYTDLVDYIEPRSRGFGSRVVQPFYGWFRSEIPVLQSVSTGLTHGFVPPTRVQPTSSLPSRGAVLR